MNLIKDWGYAKTMCTCYAAFIITLLDDWCPVITLLLDLT